MFSSVRKDSNVRVSAAAVITLSPDVLVAEMPRFACQTMSGEVLPTHRHSLFRLKEPLLFDTFWPAVRGQARSRFRLVRAGLRKVTGHFARQSARTKFDQPPTREEARLWAICRHCGCHNNNRAHELQNTREELNVNQALDESSFGGGVCGRRTPDHLA